MDFKQYDHLLDTLGPERIISGLALHRGAASIDAVLAGRVTACRRRGAPGRPYNAAAIVRSYEPSVLARHVVDGQNP